MIQKFQIHVLCFCALLISWYPAEAQTIKSFTATDEGYIRDLQKFLSETNQKETEKLMKEFIPFWNSGELTSAQKELIYQNSNAMLKKRLKAFPDFVMYMQALMGFVKSRQSPENFKSWHESMGRMLQGSVRRFSDYLEVCTGLFQQNTLYESANVRWSSSSNSYTFGFDSLPKITFGEMTLTCSAKNDSIVIRNTKGVYYPSLRIFYGDGGRVSWERAGLPAADVYALLKRFSINLSGSEYSADSVTFYYRMIFPEPMLGKLTDKLLANTTVENASYPRFRSYSLNQQIKDLIPAADFIGGFSLHGSRMIGSGTGEGDAKLIFRFQNKPLMVLSSKSFVVRPERVSSDRASMVIYWEHDGKTDSIYHSDIEFKYLTREEEVTILRNTQSNSNSPFYNTFHQVDMYCDAIVWKVRDPQIHIKMVSGGAESKMTFESANYFREQRFRKLQGLNDEHPLYRIRKYAELTGARAIYASDLASAWKISETQIRNLFIELSNEGFLSYDAEEGKAVLKDKVNFYLKASVGKVDYDIIAFNSLISAKPNATINLLNFDITMRGVSQVMLSDSQQVYVVPKDQELILKANRDFICSGRIRAGHLDFFGNDFMFDYDKFKIILQNVDSLRLRVPGDELDQYGRKIKIPLRSVIENLTGELLIDSESNRSGFRPSPSFPVFKSTKESYVFYEYKHIFDSIYRKSNFYFKLDPFTLDSLDNYSREGVAFSGVFNSAGIFPPMRETLLIQEDLSLGFSRMTAAEGLLAYNGKGTFYEKLQLSHRGLRGKGKIDYLASTSVSDDIIFFPDSANYDASMFELQKRTVGGTAYPDVKAKDVYINWRPKEDKMFVFKKSFNMDLYDRKAALDGNLTLTNKSVEAYGRILFEQAELVSNLFYLNQTVFGADTADFKLNADTDKALALSTKNMRSKVDLEKREGEFSSNGSGSYVNFPVNRYICFIEHFKWYFDRKDIQFLAGAGKTKMNVEGAEFVSVHPLQDSLRFFAPEANYSLTDYFIRAKGVKQILVADAFVIPDEGNVTVEKEARMQTLKNAKVIADTANRYHTMLNATINIEGRKKYSGDGDYSYTDMAKVKHLIRLPLIGVDTAGQTFANGEIPDTMNFSLSPNIQYKGKVTLHAASKLLYFTGLARLNHNCDALPKYWFSFASEIDPAGVNIPVANPVSETKEKLSVSISMSTDSLNVYSTFLSPKKRSSDKDLITAEGFLKYNAQNRTYTIEPLADEKTGIVSGNSITLTDNKCTIKGEGRVDFGTDFGQFILKAIGTVEHDYYRDSLRFDLFMDLNFLFSEEALKSMTEQILFNPSLSATTDNRPVYHKAIYEILGKSKGDKFLADMSLYGSVRKIPEELQHSLVLPEVKMYWDRQTQSYKSTGNIGIGIVNKQTVGRMVKGYLEIQKRKSGDVFNFYFETDPSTWYYFNYARGVMQAISSEAKFNDIINNTKEEKRIAKEKDNKAPYQYMLSTERKKNEFVKKFTEQN
jgi:hypothetical protein